jgi:DNA-binding MarR family transcriptional regulator
MTPARTAVDQVRAFNRFYTRVLGLLDRHFLQSRYSLTEVRVLYEIAHREGCTAKAVRSEMGIDAGYLSRILLSFTARGLVKSTPGRQDRRYQVLELTRKGKDAFAKLDTSQDNSVEALVDGLSARDRDALVRHMGRIRELLGGVERAGGKTDGWDSPGSDRDPKRA